MTLSTWSETTSFTFPWILFFGLMQSENHFGISASLSETFVGGEDSSASSADDCAGASASAAGPGEGTVACAAAGGDEEEASSAAARAAFLLSNRRYEAGLLFGRPRLT